MHEAAVAATGLDDFGDNDYCEGLQVLLEAYDNTAQFGDTGRFSCYAMLVNCLRGRLLAQDGIKKLPQCVHNKVEKPLFVIGLPRTGTTILHKLLAQETNNQGLEYWLGSFPQPRPPLEERENNKYFQEIASSLEGLRSLNPDMQTIHEMTVDGVDECRLLLMQSFANVTFQAGATIPDYERWLYQSDLQNAYQLYASSLKLIGSNEPEKRWVLKDPSHLWAMETLLETFPDACIIQTHRDPVKLIASVCSLVMSARTMNEPEASPEAVGAQQLEQWAIVLERSMAVRERYPNRFVDVYFDDFMADPVAVVKNVYLHFGDELSDKTAARMTHWMNQNPQGKHGGHQYSPEAFGLSERKILDRFAHYKSHYGL